MTQHQQLTEAAVRWLSQRNRCNIAISGIASTSEIPDAIGWSTFRPHLGSIVIECKCSRQDFLADKQKRHKLRMGTYRYFLVAEGFLTADQVLAHYPDHGLLYRVSRGIRVVMPAPRREKVNQDAEIRLLQMALAHVRDNLLDMGFVVNMNELTKFHSKKGIRVNHQSEMISVKVGSLNAERD